MRVWRHQTPTRKIDSCGGEFGFLVRFILAVALPAAYLVALAASPALAVPSFAKQTGQPCAVCHVGAFGPQLKPTGRDFKLRGYVGSDGEDHGLPLSVITSGSFTHVGPRPPASRESNNLAFTGGTLYYAGRIVSNLGAFFGLNYDAVNRQAQVGRADIRYARETRLFGKDVVWGLTVNNNPTVQDVWNSTPAFGFPFWRSPQAPRPRAGTQIDGRLRQRVVGASAYALWNDLIYMEFGAYKGLSDNWLNAAGKVPLAGADRFRGATPYGRLALMKDWERHHVEVGTYGLATSVFPRGVQFQDRVNRFADVGVDATYQFIVNPAKVASDMLSAHATFIRETAQLEASQALKGARLSQTLDTFRANITYSFGATITPSVQYFQTRGTRDPKTWATPNGSPNTSGMTYEVAYVPWGTPDSPAPIPGLNARLVLQYTDYFRFDGSAVGAKRNNSIGAGLTAAIAF